MKEEVKEDLAWLPSFDPEFKRYLKSVLMEHGWPKGPINAVELWNEPWEGVSISGWGADILRYREIYQVMAEAVLEARKEAGVKVLIGGACSSANTRDKLFCDGTDTFLPWLDFVSIHYQPLAADPVLEPKWMNRQGEYGRVRVWDTESWVANSDDRVAAVIASMRAMGQDRTAGIYAGNVFTSQKPPHQRQGIRRGASLGAGRGGGGLPEIHRPARLQGDPVQERLAVGVRLRRIARTGGDERTGPANPDDGTVVIVGDLGASYDKNRTLFRSVGLAKDAQYGTQRWRRPVRPARFLRQPRAGEGRQDRRAAERTGLLPAHRRQRRARSQKLLAALAHGQDHRPGSGGNHRLRPDGARCRQAEAAAQNHQRPEPSGEGEAVA